LVNSNPEIVMTRVLLGMGAFVVGVALIASPAASQPPDEKGGKGGKDGKGPPRFELGQIFPPPLEAELNLTAAQQKELDTIKKDLKSKLEKLLTADQKKTVQNFRPRGPGGPGGPGGKGGKGGEGGERPPFEKNEKEPPAE
jgi:Spy/CpxP family protein refolding chaperone